MPGQTLTPAEAAARLGDVDPLWRAFWFHMHLMAKNLGEFAEGLEAITDDVYDYHVNGHANDLARWVREVVGDGMLADQLETAKNRHEAAAMARTRMDTLARIVKRS